MHNELNYDAQIANCKQPVQIIRATNYYPDTSSNTETSSNFTEIKMKNIKRTHLQSNQSHGFSKKLHGTNIIHRYNAPRDCVALC